MTTISEKEFRQICTQIYQDREQIYKFNPNAEQGEVLLWMLLSCLISYLNLSEQETPCFPGAPDAQIYRQAILFILNNRTEPKFNPEIYLNELLESVYTEKA